MPTNSERHVLTLPPAHIAPGLAATAPKCTTQPNIPAKPPHASISCHEKHETVTILRTFCTPNAILCAPSVQDRPRTDRDRILLRESIPISCHEEREVFLEVRPIRPRQPIRYPIDTPPIPDFRKARSLFASHPDAPGPIPARIGPILANLSGPTEKETDATIDFEPDFEPDFGTRRRSGPRRGPSIKKKPGLKAPGRQGRCMERFAQPLDPIVGDPVPFGDRTRLACPNLSATAKCHPATS